MRKPFLLIGAASFVACARKDTPPASKNSPQVIDHVVGRKTGDKWMSTAVTTLTAKPDSVVMRTRWEATKSP